ncbi:hypothetical protein CP980_34250 [Streptomyces vinaceus]|uniref:Uncharacterized protein n=2 Tax=Streptomyces vinaceus TaxID=1960 RepID=A0A5J6JIB4_STRVI|nr:hypothetical protein CP980_34250 [Streptomyces vinaceus]
MVWRRQGDSHGGLTLDRCCALTWRGLVGQSPYMVQNLVAVFSLLIGLGGLTLSFMDHRRKIRQEAQESALRAEEARQRHERDLEQQLQWIEREQRSQRGLERHQASLVKARFELRPSSLHNGWIVPEVVVENRSDQPVRDVRVAFLGDVIGESTTLDTGQDAFQLAPVQAARTSHKLRHVTVDFTDVAGIRWRRDGYGLLRRAQPGAGDPDAPGAWGEPEPPTVLGPASAPALPPVRQRVGFLRPAVALISVTLIAGGLWWLLRH